jgi:hypothetical protein
MLAKKLYLDLDVRENKADDAVDKCGYHGEFNRRARTDLKPYSEQQWRELVVKDKRLKDVFLRLRQIDLDRSGFVTQLELDDIIKMIYPELANNDLSEIIRPFCRPTNKILVEYRKFRTYLEGILKVARDDAAVNQKLDDIISRLKSRSRSAVRSQMDERDARNTSKMSAQRA